MKTFADLIEEVQKPGLCHHCGGCVTFCSAINYGALELGEDGRPHYKDQSKCIECGLCYLICPEIQELDEEVKRAVAWAPLGCGAGILLARAASPGVRARGTDGGMVTALLLHLLDKGHLDGAIVTKQVGPFQRQPWLAESREEILEAAGFHFDTSHGMKLFADAYSTFSPSIQELGHIAKGHLQRVAFVGTPCQINTVRRMEVLGIVPSHAIKFHFGLFCTGNFYFGPPQRRRLEEIGNFAWEDVRKINVKEELLIHLHQDEVRHIPLDRLDFMKRDACRYCDDYTARYADISFGGVGAPEGWTTVVSRTPLGNSILAGARGLAFEEYNYRGNSAPGRVSEVLAKVLECSKKKRARAEANRQELAGKRQGDKTGAAA